MLPNPEVSYWCDRIRKHYTDPTKSGSIIRIRPYPDPLASYGSAFFIRIRLNPKAAWIIWIRPYPEAPYESDCIREHHTDQTVTGSESSIQIRPYQESQSIIRIRKHNTDSQPSSGSDRFRIHNHHQDPTESEFANIIRIRQFPNSQPSSGSDRIRIQIHHPDSNVY